MSSRCVFAMMMLAGLAAFVGSALSEERAKEKTPPAQQKPISDLIVTLQHVSGKVETFKDEVARLELILDETGRLDQVHLIARTGSEADTHIWYNVNNLVSVRYQFLAITGKGKVAVRTLAAPKPKAKIDFRKELQPLSPDDYR